MLDLTSYKSVEKCLIKDPIMLAAETTLLEAANTMASLKRTCELQDKTSDTLEVNSSRASCILVMAGQQLQGIVTERDLLKWVILDQNWQQITLKQIMTTPVISLTWDQSLTPLHISQLLQKHRIRHLPVLDTEGKLFGLITHRLLRGVIEPVHLLRLRFVTEVMVSRVVYGAPQQSMWHLAKVMMECRVGSIVIVKPHPTLEQAWFPLGIVTEQDILHLRSLDVDLQKITAEQTMTRPTKIAVHRSLIEAKQLMERHQTHRLIVVGEHHELLGLVTQSNLLEAMNQNEMYGLVSFLEQQIKERTQELDRLNQKLRQEVQERKKAENRIRQLSLTDELTGVYNRRGFFMLVEQELSLLERQKLPFSLFFFDVDNLKMINDHLGHGVGDRVIVDAAQILRDSFRRADILARLGGDEFTCFAPVNQAEADLICQRLQTAIANFNQQQQRPYQLSISTGYASYTEFPANASLRTLLKQADEKMYRNKQQRKQGRQSAGDDNPRPNTTKQNTDPDYLPKQSLNL
ncbi:diguanylate cyclase [Picosynechococcus sp. PCC 8807]|uniref:diguanylate cyclase n=1 Tax=Picosynechococcus sp. PCC 8807 TaxID=195248 RepID=UPI00081056B8|nr:GGDEF domain-containing protein [Picosynechococcus sp. PCC 8807]ANV90498.1 diguanylate cyclase [Picosynechococcus sp. PCC 8807]